MLTKISGIIICCFVDKIESFSCFSFFFFQDLKKKRKKKKRQKKKIKKNPCITFNFFFFPSMSSWPSGYNISLASQRSPVQILVDTIL
jgi:hypothetical protein